VLNILANEKRGGRIRVPIFGKYVRFYDFVCGDFAVEKIFLSIAKVPINRNLVKRK